MKTFAERLKWARNQKELSQAALSDRVGISQSTIGNLESPASKRKTSRFILPISLALNVDPLWLAEGKGVSTVAPPRMAIPDDAVLFLTPGELARLMTYRQASADARMVIDSAFAIVSNMSSLARHKA